MGRKVKMGYSLAEQSEQEFIELTKANFFEMPNIDLDSFVPSSSSQYKGKVGGLEKKEIR